MHTRAGRTFLHRHSAHCQITSFRHVDKCNLADAKMITALQGPAAHTQDGSVSWMFYTPLDDPSHMLSSSNPLTPGSTHTRQPSSIFSFPSNSYLSTVSPSIYSLYLHVLLSSLRPNYRSRRLYSLPHNLSPHLFPFFLFPHNSASPFHASTGSDVPLVELPICLLLVRLARVIKN